MTKIKDVLEKISAQNKNLHSAKRNKNDEFYTQFSDIEKELSNYKEHFKDKIVFCNCDDPSSSEFVKYFALNFDFFGLKKLITTHYEREQSSYKLEITKKIESIEELEKLQRIKLEQNGDFRSPECIELLKETDIICTNPPFSLFREYIAQLIEYEKSFLVIGNSNAITYKETFPLIQENKIWLGCNPVKEFRTPTGEIKKFGNIVWFTNLTHKKRNDTVPLFRDYYGNEEDYPCYENYDAIEVSKVVNIPRDFNGVMGVPISFLNKYNPNQFEIIDINPHFFSLVKKGGKKPKQLSIKGRKDPYARILIKTKT